MLKSEETQPHLQTFTLDYSILLCIKQTSISLVESNSCSSFAKAQIHFILLIGAYESNILAGCIKLHFKKCHSMLLLFS